MVCLSLGSQTWDWNREQPVTVLCPLAGSCEYVDEPPFISIIIIIIQEHAANYNHCHRDLSWNSHESEAKTCFLPGSNIGSNRIYEDTSK